MTESQVKKENDKGQKLITVLDLSLQIMYPVEKTNYQHEMDKCKYHTCEKDYWILMKSLCLP